MLTILCALKWRISVKGPCRNAFLAYTFNLTKAAVKSRSFFDIAKNIFHHVAENVYFCNSNAWEIYE